MMSRSILILFIMASQVLAEPNVVWKERLEVHGVNSASLLRVLLLTSDGSVSKDRSAVSGEWLENGSNSFAFKPNFPLILGGKYRVVDEKSTKIGEILVPDRRAKTPPILMEVFPSGSRIPENTLRFYFVFSKSMSRGEAYKRVKILDENSKAVDQPFLELEEELWENDQKRLTLLIDPGRIKQEVKPRLDLGPVFRAGKKFTIIVDGKWPDSTGAILGNDWRREVVATDPRMIAPTAKDWKITAPNTAKQELTITFPVAMDESLLRRTLSVLTMEGKEISGKVLLEKNETVWKFVPDLPWKSALYSIRLDWKLEDVSGNAIERPFEAEESTPVKDVPARKSSLIPFEVRLK